MGQGLRTRRHTFTSRILMVLGLVCLGQGLLKGVLWVAGSRATGLVVYQEDAVTRQGATWTRYAFTARNGRPYDGRAMTAAKGALHARVRIAYLPLVPDLNMPAYGGYATVLGLAWSCLGLVLLGSGRVLRAK
jgi:hypothetical protein